MSEKRRLYFQRREWKLRYSTPFYTETMSNAHFLRILMVRNCDPEYWNPL